MILVLIIGLSVAVSSNTVSTQGNLFKTLVGLVLYVLLSLLAFFCIRMLTLKTSCPKLIYENSQ
jgi:tellurite resistance protein TehA-like permease